jgi:PilZ domain
VTENRRSPRKRVLKGAIAVFNGRQSTYDCTVRDISESGCRLAVRDAMTIPETFELVIEVDGTNVPCLVVRRKASELGVMFTGPVVQASSKRTQIVHAERPAIPPARPSLRKIV